MLLAIVQKNTVSKIPIKIVFELNVKHITSADPAVDLVNVITNQLGLCGINSELFTVWSESYNHVLVHGVLELDSALKQSDKVFYILCSV